MTTTMSSPLSSAPSSPSRPSASDNLSAQLDSQIDSLNAQISALRQQHQSLSSAILSSSSLQKFVQSHKSNQYETADTSEVDMYRRLEQAVKKAQARNDIKVHRLVNNVTTFPFVDPAPDRQHEGAMLGLRFEMPSTPGSLGTSTKKQNDANDDDTEAQRVYLVVLRRFQYRRKTYLQFQPEMNQIPKHIDVEGYAAQYLPVPDIDDENDRTSPTRAESESFQDDSGIDVTQDLTQIVNAMNGQQAALVTNVPQRPPVDIVDTNQNLHLFVATIRNALLSWHYRTSYTNHIITTLSLPSTSPAHFKHCISHIQSNPPATQMEIDWVNGTTGLLGITENGFIGIARVFGPRLTTDDEEVQGHGEDTYRCHSIERRLEGAGFNEFVERLDEVGKLMSTRK